MSITEDIEGIKKGDTVWITNGASGPANLYPKSALRITGQGKVLSIFLQYGNWMALVREEGNYLPLVTSVYWLKRK